MKNPKRLIILAMLVASSMMSYAQSVGNTIKYDGVTYTFTGVTEGNRTVKISAIDATITGEVTFPSEILDAEGNYTYKVTAVQCAFGSNDISKLTIPENVTSITSFRGTKIKEVYLPTSLKSITYGVDAGMQLPALTAFHVAEGNTVYSSDENGLLYNADKTTLMWYPEGKTATSFTVPDGVKAIKGQYAIRNNYLEEIIFPNSVETVDGGTIYCNKLVSISVPKSLTTFSGVSSPALQKYIVDFENPNYCDIDGVLCDHDKTTILHYPANYAQRDYIVPSTITTIAANSFRNNWKCKITSIDFTQSKVTTIKQYAFYTCTYLKTAKFNEGLETIESNAFAYSGLNSATFPESLTTIGQQAFYQCSLSTIYIPASLTDIGNGALSNNTKIEKYIVAEGNPNYSSDEFGVLFNKDKTTLVAYPPARNATYYDIPENTITINNYAFGRAGYLTAITIPTTLKTIGGQAFEYCTKLTDIIYSQPCSLDKIGSAAFRSCSSLTHFDLPPSVSGIGLGSLVFQFCSGLTEFKIPDNSKLTSTYYNNFLPGTVKKFTIGKNTAMKYYTGCGSNIEEFIVEEGNTSLTSISGFKNNTNLRKVEIADDCGLNTIGSEAFFGCTNLTEIKLPQAVSTLGTNAFYNTPNLKTITFAEPSQLKTIGENAFQECGIESFSLPTSVQKIERQAFHNCQVLTDITLPKNTTSVDPEAFYLCSNLTAINVDADNEVYSSSDGILCNKEKTELRIFPAGKASEHFTLLPPSLTSIGKQAFFACKALKKVMIPKKVSSIGTSAFWLCDNLQDIVLLGDEPIEAENIGEKAFPTDIFAQAKLWVRHGTTADYATADYWKDFEETEEAKLSDDNCYEFFVMDGTNANLLSIQKDDETLLIPQTVTTGGTTYDVGLIGDYAFEDCNAAINEVVVMHPVSYVGARAFVNGDRPEQIQNVFFVGTNDQTEVSTAKFDISQNYAEVTSNQHLYVKKSAIDAYKAAWPQLTDQLSYQIPLSMTSVYGTFAREFDTDFSENNTSTTRKGWPNVVAFTAGEYGTTTDKEGNPVNFVRMTSINLGATNGDGTYIPANTGVLFLAVDGAASTGEFYYQIHEDELDDYTASNVMRGTVVRTTTVHPTETIDGTEYTNFIVSGGQLHRMTVDRQFPPHKSYLQLPTSLLSNGAKLTVVFDAPDEATGLSEWRLGDLGQDDRDAPTYNVAGQRVTSDYKGLVIRNGKKVIMK